MKFLTKKISHMFLILVITLAVVLNIGCGNQENQMPSNKNQDENEIQFPIDSKEEAINYAKTDPDVIKYINDFSEKGFSVSPWAKFVEDENIWIVVIPIVDAEDLWYEIHFKTDGTILSKGEGEGG